jgi:hypothetical protein
MWQTASDFIIFLGWVWQNFLTTIGQIFLPVRYIYVFLKQFLTLALASPPQGPGIYTFDTGVLSIFAQVPYWNILIFSAVLGITILMIVFILKTFLKT